MDPHDAEFRTALSHRISSYRARRARLERRKAEVDAELEEVDARLVKSESLYMAEFGEQPPDGADNITTDQAERLFQPAAEAVRGPMTGLSWEDALVRALNGHDGGLHVRAIWEQLQGGGFRTEARDPVRSIVAIALRRPDTFVRVAPNTYALINQAVTSAGAAGARPEAEPLETEVE